ncbi:MAG: dockerin type I repeat-containing protein [Patescibacteria group bacterium]
MARKLGKFFRKIQRRAPSPRRAFLSGLATVLLAASIIGILIRPAPAQAQWVISAPLLESLKLAQEARERAKTIFDRIADVAIKVAKKAGDVAYKSGLRVFLGKIAEDTATWVASGGQGQSPLFITDPNYFRDLGNAAAGDFLDTLSKSEFGVSICDPGIAKIQIDLALRANLNPNFCQENCQKNFEDGKDSMQVPLTTSIGTVGTASASQLRIEIKNLQEGITKGSGSTFVSPTCTTIGLKDRPAECLTELQKLVTTAEQKLQADLKLCVNRCTSAKTRRTTSCTLTAISNNVQNSLSQSGISVNTPFGSGGATAASLQQAFDSGDLPNIFKPTENPIGQYLTFYNQAQQEAKKKEDDAKTLQIFGGSLPITALISGQVKTPAFLTQSGSEEALSVKNSTEAELKQTGSPIADAFGIFTNTLTNKLIERIFSKGIADPKAKSLAFKSGNLGGATGGVAAAKERFASLGQVNLGTGGGIDILTELSSCPVEPSSVSLQSPNSITSNNCVLESNFRQAVEEKLTVQQAIDRKLLTDQKVFGFDANGREPDFRSGYPYRSLKILRKYRIIPVGWELAAQYIRDFERQNVNLGAIVGQFDNPDSPYYRLIDPSWVLKAPENICLRTGFTADIVSQEYLDDDGDEGGRKNIDYALRYCNNESDKNVGKVCECTDGGGADDPTCAASSPDTDTKTGCVNNTNATTLSTQKTCAFITPRQEQIQRREACVDERTCVLENDDGTCKQFGTCTEEKDTWRFNGQSCNNVYASCQTFTDSAGQSASYLQNTLQPDSCGADNAGCQQYCTAYDYTAGKWMCASGSTANTVRFDRDAQECDASAEGCTQFLRMSTGTNLVANGNFEESAVANPAQNANFSGWVTGDGSQACGAQSFASTQAFAGGQSARIQYLPDCGGGNAAHTFTTIRDTGVPLRDRTFTVSFYAKSESISCVVDTTLGSGTEFSPSANPTITPGWQRFSYAYTFLSSQARSDVNLVFRPSTACTYLLDNVQVEEGSQLTDYKDYGAVNQVHLKRPADGLACTGNVATDPAACSKFITKCTANDVGCDLFTPLAGGSNVPAKGGISCPADKVGCATFREQPIASVLAAHETRTGKYCKSKLVNSFVSCSDDSQCGGVAGDCQPLVSFIAKTGVQCTAQDVGCEAFTNLDQVAQGGEGKAQFTKLQLCVQPNDPGLKNYYAWTGDNETGYQLKQYRLKQSNVGTGPCTNLATGQTLPLNCIDNSSPQTAVIDCQASFGTNPDCGQYYDDAGQVYYRLRSRLIEGTADCHPFRNTADNNVYYADGTRSLSCSAAAVGCREYVGNTGSNTRTLLTSEFENGSYAPWVVSNPVNPSTESVNFGGHSLHVSGTPTAQNQSVALTRGKSYVLNFWAKAASATILSANVGTGAGTAQLGNVSVGTEWNVYTLGPGLVDFDTTGTNALTISGTAGVAYFLDNITLTEITDSIYRVKASQTACGGFEGCQEYRNRSNQVNTYAGFTRLCKSEVVGCEALINTRNTASAYSATTSFPSQRGDVDGSGRVDNADRDYLSAYLFTSGPAPSPMDAGDVDADGGVDISDVNALVNFLNLGGQVSAAPYPGDTVTTPGDVVEYWVNDPAKACRGEEKGCRALGKQTFDATGGVQSTATTYLLDTPDAYPTIMCGRGTLFCEEYTTSEGGKAYFRNPGSKVCSYRDVSGNKAAGWYIDGTDTPCPTRTLNNIPPAVPNGGYAGLCPAEQNGCGNFLDPIGTGASLSRNSSLEVDNGSAAPNTLPQGWTAGTCSNGIQCGSNADCNGALCTLSGSVKAYSQNLGSQAVRAVITGQGTFSQSISLDANTYYVLSADVTKGDVAMTDIFRMGVVSCKNAQGAAVAVSSPDASMVPDTSGANARIPADRFSDKALRVSSRFFSGNAVTCSIIGGAVAGTAGYWLDNFAVTPTTSTSVIRQSVDANTCNGQVGDKLGCRLFNDLSNTSLAYDADQSPVGGSPTNPDVSGSPSACADHPELCDSNTLLKVQRDRQCSQWLAPSTVIESTKPNGQKENLTLGLATCDSFSPSGQCNHFVDELRCSNKPKQTCVQDSDCGGGVCKPMQFTGNTAPYSIEDLRNKSGLVVAGMQWASDQLVKGKYLFGAAPQVGNDGIAVADDVLNGTFSKSKILSTSGWKMFGATDADPATSPNGSKLSLVTSEVRDAGKNTSAPVTVNPFITVTPAAGAVVAVRTSTATLANRLTPGRSYTLSFSARYVQAPDQVAGSDTRLTAGISSGNSVDAPVAWSGTVVPTAQWQRYTVGPLKLTAGAGSTPAQGNSVGLNHLGYQADQGFVFFSVGATNRNAFAIDNVSVLPTLNVEDAPTVTTTLQGQLAGTTQIPRTCRAYPNSTALDCSYQDDTGKRYAGWQGYCLEPDPRNPSLCLSWYPIDVLAGDRNVFGKVEAAGYQDRTPLYACVQSSGNYSSTLFDGNSYTLTSSLTNQTQGYRRPITTRINGANNDNNGECDVIGNAFCSRDKDALPDGSSGMPGICGCAENISLETTVPARVEDQYYEYEIEKIDWTITLGSNVDWPVNTTFTTSAANNWNNYWSAGNNEIRAQVNFSNTTPRRIVSFTGYVNDGSDGLGGAMVAGIVHLKEWCTQVVKVADGTTNAAWSKNISSNTFTLPNFGYGLYQDAKPFGTINQPEANFDRPTGWDGGLGGPMQLKFGTTDARAGSTFSCLDGRDCSKRYCSTNYANTCATQADIIKCGNATSVGGDGGYCIGSAPVKVCISAAPSTDVGKACTQNTECGTGGVCDYANASGGYVGQPGARYATEANAAETQPSIDSRTIARLRLLFADAYEGWEWNRATNAYAASTGTQTLPGADVGFTPIPGSTLGTKISAWTSAYDSMVRCGQPLTYNGTTKSTDRGFLSSIADAPFAYCGETPEVLNVSIGQGATSDVVVNSGELIQLRFNTAVDSQQLPLKNIAIDWNGDEKSDEILPWGFAPRTDPADPHSISHVYRFGSNAGDCYARGTGPYATRAQVSGREYCVATPQVQVQDNWEWCNYRGAISTTRNGRCTSFPAQGLTTEEFWEPAPHNIIIVR